MKYLFLAGLFLLLCFLLYRRLRPYLSIARRVFDSVQAVRAMNAEAGRTRVPAEKRAMANSLVRCTACGTWLPQSRALQSRNATQTFCSAACLEQRAVTNIADTERARKTAS